jgi:hypothetical protein
MNAAGSDLVGVLVPTGRHHALLRATVRELGHPRGNLFNDLHTAVLMGTRSGRDHDRGPRFPEVLRVTSLVGG